jgi:hypothetical protein
MCLFANGFLKSRYDPHDRTRGPPVNLLLQYSSLPLIWEAHCKIWGFHGGDYEEFRLLGYKSPVRTSQETHNVSATVLRRLILCKIWGFHGGDYEEFRLLGYKYPVRTSKETHYVSVTEPSHLMLCKIWDFHRSDYDEWRLLGYRNPVRTS